MLFLRVVVVVDNRPARTGTGLAALRLDAPDDTRGAVVVDTRLADTRLAALAADALDGARGAVPVVLDTRLADTALAGLALDAPDEARGTVDTRLPDTSPDALAPDDARATVLLDTSLACGLVLPNAIGELLLLLCFLALGFVVGLLVQLLSGALLRRVPACCWTW
jgi:hypothetical protein